MKSALPIIGIGSVSASPIAMILVGPIAAPVAFLILALTIVVGAPR